MKLVATAFTGRRTKALMSTKLSINLLAAPGGIPQSVPPLVGFDSANTVRNRMFMSSSRDQRRI